MTKSKKRLLSIIVCGSIIVILITLAIIKINIPEDNKLDATLSMVFDLLGTVGVIASILFTGFSLTDNSDAQLASFVQDLNASFIESGENKEVYNKLSACHHDHCKECENCKKNPNFRCILAKEFDEEIGLSNYLTFFGTIYVLLKREVVKMDYINELFSYRFFVAVHSKVMQEERLNNPDYNFANIIELERKWIEFKIKNKEFTKEEYQNAIADYRKVRKGEMTELEVNQKYKHIALRRPLTSMFDKD